MAQVRFKETGEVREYLHYDPLFEGEGGYAVVSTPDEVKSGLQEIEWYSSGVVDDVAQCAICHKIVQEDDIRACDKCGRDVCCDHSTEEYDLMSYSSWDGSVELEVLCDECRLGER